MLVTEGIEENLRFLVKEVRQQLVHARDLTTRPTDPEVGLDVGRDDYVDNLKTVIQRKCFEAASTGTGSPAERPTVELLKGIEAVAVNLERIADFCENIAGQFTHLDDPAILANRPVSTMFDDIIAGVDMVPGALFARDTQAALQICRVEHKTDRVYSREFARLLTELQGGRDVGDLVTVIFILRYLERMGDSLLNIGEAILSTSLGQRVKIDQFQALEDALESADVDADIDDMYLESIRETKSGTRINQVRRKPTSAPDHLVIFKDGLVEKLRQERDAALEWQRIMPGVAPRVLAFNDRDDHGSILFEFLEGRNLEEILLQGSRPGLDTALDALMDVVARVWNASAQAKPVAPRFIEQLQKRLPALYMLHPGFRDTEFGVGRIKVPSFDALARSATPLDERLKAPFTVRIHGDFNLDNIIYNTESGRIHFVDLHRSREFDYVQDISVFMVSCYRLQVFDEPVRRLIGHTIEQFYRFASGVARDFSDQTFHARLAAGLARSLATSARFVLSDPFARTMFLRARYLLEHLVAHDPEELADFKLPLEVLFD